jgi:hypothetical protein
MKSKLLTLDGLKGLNPPRPWKALARVACENQSHISIKEPVVVSGRELSRLEAKIQAVRARLLPVLPIKVAVTCPELLDSVDFEL